MYFAAVLSTVFQPSKLTNENIDSGVCLFMPSFLDIILYCGMLLYVIP